MLVIYKSAEISPESKNKKNLAALMCMYYQKEQRV